MLKKTAVTAQIQTIIESLISAFWRAKLAIYWIFYTTRAVAIKFFFLLGAQIHFTIDVDVKNVKKNKLDTSHEKFFQ